MGVKLTTSCWTRQDSTCDFALTIHHSQSSDGWQPHVRYGSAACVTLLSTWVPFLEKLFDPAFRPCCGSRESQSLFMARFQDEMIWSEWVGGGWWRLNYKALSRHPVVFSLSHVKQTVDTVQGRENHQATGAGYGLDDRHRVRCCSMMLFTCGFPVVSNHFEWVFKTCVGWFL